MCATPSERKSVEARLHGLRGPAADLAMLVLLAEREIAKANEDVPMGRPRKGQEKSLASGETCSAAELSRFRSMYKGVEPEHLRG